MTTSLPQDATPSGGAPKPPAVGRLAPTPSGRMHLGNAFSAIVAWASARSRGGKVILRIEDLDPRAQDPQNARMLVDDLRWLGIDWDEGPVYQSDRTEVYLQQIDALAQKGITYPCFCTRSELHAATAPHASDGTYLYPGTCRGLSPQEVAERSRKRRPATRLMVPPGDDPRGTIGFEDLGYGPHEECLAQECGDFLIRRSDGVIAYQLAVVVDDCRMGVTEVVRGRDLLPSSARQIYLARLLGMTPPRYGHVPLLVAPDGRRLSKRNHDLSLQALRENNVSPKAVVGLLASYIGLAEGEEEIDAAEFERRFSWDAIRSHREDIQADASVLLPR